MSGYIRYRSQKLKGGGFLAFSFTTKMDPAMNQSCVQQYITQKHPHLLLKNYSFSVMGNSH